MNDVELSNKLNNAPIESIEIGDIIAFCEIRREEGIDLDYKSNWPSDLEKVICSFANTQGGIILIGVDEEEKTRKPKLPINGIEGNEPSIYQRVMNIASDGIYPPISPEVRVCGLPDQSNKFVVLIRIMPSRLMHSTDRRRRIYVRVADNSRGYDLANVANLEWLWERKTLAEEKREEIYLSAIDHSKSKSIPWNSIEDEQHWNMVPKIHVSIIPSFPSQDNSIETDRLLKVVQSIPQIRSSWNGIEIPGNIGYWRSIPGGVCISNRGYKTFLEYIEFGQMAHVHTTIGIETLNKVNEVSVDFEYAFAHTILAYIDISLKFAHKFFSAIQYTWPITVNIVLEFTDLIKINYVVPRSGSPFFSDFMSAFAPDKQLQLLNIEIDPSKLDDKETLMLSIAYNLFWAFGLGWDKSSISEWLKAATKRA